MKLTNTLFRGTLSHHETDSSIHIIMRYTYSINIGFQTFKFIHVLLVAETHMAYKTLKKTVFRIFRLASSKQQVGETQLN